MSADDVAVAHTNSDTERKEPKSFPKYAAACLTIRPKEGTPIKLTLNTVQKRLNKVADEQRAATGRVRLLVLKARQPGVSTYIEARFYWRVSRESGLRAFILTHKDEATNNLFDMAKRFHGHFEGKRPKLVKSNAKELAFDALESSYRVGTARADGVGRSDTVQLFHGSEVAHWPHAERHAAGALQAVPDAEGTEIWLESTANGSAGLFYNMIQRAELMRVSPVIARIKRKSSIRRVVSAKIHRGLRAKKAQDLKNYFGTGALGDVVISTDTSLSATLDGAPVVRHYNSLTINSGATLTTNNRCKGLVIYVRGDCTINGTLTMSGKGAQATPTRDLSIYRAPFSGYAYSSGTPDIENLPDETLSICKSGVGRKVYRSAHNTAELMGTTGLAATRTYYGGHYGFGGVSFPATTGGWPGNEAPGGGGGGNGGNSMTPPYTAHPTVGGYDGYDVNHPSTGWTGGGRPGARGGNGTAFSGGPGGGGGGWDSENTDPTPGNLNGGGPGGAGGSNGGGNGASGGGGVIFLIVGGVLTIGASGTISSDGTIGSAGTGFSGGGGGGSGGGRLIILYAQSLSNAGAIHADGGAGGPPSQTSWTVGGGGGAGAITVERIKTG